MEIKQQLKLSQQLVMTPQLQQAIRLLQLSRLELIDEIRKELDANPVLADEEIDPRARANGDAKNGEVINEPPPPDSPAMAAEKAIVSDLEKRSEEKRVQEIDWEQFEVVPDDLDELDHDPNPVGADELDDLDGGP